MQATLDLIRQEPLFSSSLTGGALLSHWSNLGIELLVYVIAAMCLRHAWRARPADGDPNHGVAGREWVSVMAGAVLLTFVIELLLSHSFHADASGQMVRLYEYPPGSFLIAIKGVPLWVPVGWCFILYATMRTTTFLGAAWYIAPLLDGFLALNLDLSLDPVAIHQDWWDWMPGAAGTGVDANSYFGIPLVNFMGWFVIVGSYSLFARRFFAARRRRGWLPGTAGNVLVVTAAIVASLIVVAVYQSALGPHLTPVAVMLAWMVAAAIVARHMMGFRVDAPVERLFIAVPIVFHAYCIAVSLVTTAQSPPSDKVGSLLIVEPELSIFMPVAALLGLWLYSWPYLGTLADRSRITNRPASGG